MLAAASERRARSSRPPRSTRDSTSAAERTASPSAPPRCATALAAARASARPRGTPRRTTSRARRSPPSCARTARSAPTSAAPARRSTASSTAPRDAKRAARAFGHLRADLDHGSSVVRLNRDVRRARDRARHDAFGSLAARAPPARHALDRRLRGAALPLRRPPLVGGRRARDRRGRLLVVRRPAHRSDTLRQVELDLRRVAAARPLRPDRPHGRQGARDRVIVILAIVALFFLFRERTAD